MKTEKTDYLVIGLGPAGMACTLMAHSMGLNVTAIEKRKIGGECLNYGCIPSKALIKACKVKYWSEHANNFGLAPATLKPVSVFKRVRDVVYTVNQEKTSKLFEKVNVILGEHARFIDPYTVETDNHRITAKKIFLCLGTRPRLPSEVKGFSSIPYLTNETVFDIDDIPESIIVLGGGPIACELGQCFRRLGSNVTLINKASRLLPKAEELASSVLEKVFREEGITVVNGANVVQFERAQDKVKALLDDGRIFEGDTVLVAIGREFDYRDLKLENAGVNHDSSGIKVNDYLETSQKHIYAVGDCNGYRLFTHAAMHQGMCAIMNSLIPGWMWFMKRKFKNYVVPWSVFTEPEVSSVGYTEAELIRLGIKYDSEILYYADYGRALADACETGFVKIYFKRGVKPVILGATIVGENSSEMIQEWALAIQKKLTLYDIMFLQHSFPTFGFLSKRVPESWMMRTLQEKAFLKAFIKRWANFS
ncbi:MAG: NAD(P)/FAD-dependent oxidoreductase [Deltaproteobacteria bacterium]|nr:NAD(P)/FAD-dependent oxidoreductase [Deltaproteobacteria bacterium]